MLLHLSIFHLVKIIWDSMIYNNVNGLNQMLNFCNYMKVKEFIFIALTKLLIQKKYTGISKKLKIFSILLL